MKKIKSLAILFLLIVLLVLPYFVFAQNPALSGLEGIQGESGYAEADEYSMAGIVGAGINLFLSLLGIIFIVLMLFAGYNWMMAQDDDERINKAKGTIRRAIIGLIITVGSYAIWNFIYYNFIDR